MYSLELFGSAVLDISRFDDYIYIKIAGAALSTNNNISNQ